MAGDYNTPLNSTEVYKRSFDNNAKKQAKTLRQVLERLDLKDAWESNSTSHTWTNRGASSRLDRICYSLEQFNIMDTLVDWGLCKSDHAAVICLFKKISSKPNMMQSKIPYLNNALLDNPMHMNLIKAEIGNKMQQVPSLWNPRL